MAVKRKVRKGAARTAKQKAALRKAQLASARKRRRGGSAKRPATKAKKRTSKKKRLVQAVALASVASYGYSKGKKFAELTERDRKRQEEADWVRTRAQRAKYRQNLAKYRANTRGLPSGSQKPRGSAWSYDWARSTFVL